MKSGIYRIRNLFTMKCYIGSSINLAARKTAHFSELRRNKHRNIYLQRSYNLYGVNAFVFEVIEYVKVDDLIAREIHYINLYKYKYNIQTSNDVDRFTCSDETKHNLSKRMVQEVVICGIRYSSHNEASEKLGICGRTIVKLKTMDTDQQKVYMTKSKVRKGKHENWLNKTYFICPLCKNQIRANFNIDKKCCGSCEWKNGKVSPRKGMKANKDSIMRAVKTRRERKVRYKPVIINNVRYESLTQASKILNINIGTMCTRLKRGYPGYSYAS